MLDFDGSNVTEKVMFMLNLDNNAPFYDPCRMWVTFPSLQSLVTNRLTWVRHLQRTTRQTFDKKLFLSNPSSFESPQKYETYIIMKITGKLGN